MEFSESKESEMKIQLCELSYLQNTAFDAFILTHCASEDMIHAEETFNEVSELQASTAWSPTTVATHHASYLAKSVPAYSEECHTVARLTNEQLSVCRALMLILASSVKCPGRGLPKGDFCHVKSRVVQSRTTEVAN